MAKIQCDENRFDRNGRWVGGQVFDTNRPKARMAGTRDDGPPDPMPPNGQFGEPGGFGPQSGSEMLSEDESMEELGGRLGRLDPEEVERALREYEEEGYDGGPWRRRFGRDRWRGGSHWSEDFSRHEADRRSGADWRGRHRALDRRIRAAEDRLRGRGRGAHDSAPLAAWEQRFPEAARIQRSW